MPTFNPDTTTMQDAKTGAIPIKLADSIITDVKNGSAIMKLAKAVPMTKPKEQFSFLSGVGAYWVGEGERIQTSKPTWLEAYMEAHKMAVIIPTSNENLKHSVTDFFTLMRAEIAEAFYKKFDQATFFGTDTPYPQSVLGSALLAEHSVTESDNKYNDMDDILALLEEHDLDANGIAAPRSERTKYRKTKDDNGNPIFTSATSNTPADVLGLPIAWSPVGSWDKTKASELIADWNSVYYGILDGIEFKVLTEATLTTVQDENGDPINLAERDMSAIIATFTPGFMVIKDEATAAIVPADGKGTANKAAAKSEVKKAAAGTTPTEPETGTEGNE